MARDPLAWQPLLRHWCRCLGEGGAALGRLGELEAVEGLDLAALLPGGPGWADVQRSLRHDPEGAFRLLYYGLALRGLEALPAPEQLVDAGSSEVPAVSVLIPVHNHWPVTLNCLRSLVVAANHTRFEVILADDASSDATTQLGTQLPWLRIWRSEQNRGFLDTCNGAAALARGEVLLLLNNDTLLGDHGLDQLVASLERHPEAGVVGAAVWGAEGLPLEVGGIVWADGEVWNHGRGFPPELWFALAYERQTDYVSGCALAIRRPLWQELGGFDPRYRPAYCEDTDLCLRVWEAGHTVLVQPQARILHLEGLSHSRRMDTGLKTHQTTNLLQLRQRWQRRLDTQQPPTGMPWLLAADPALRNQPIALLTQASATQLTLCRERGYGVLLLGSEQPPEDPAVCTLPEPWADLAAWLPTQLREPWCNGMAIIDQSEQIENQIFRRLFLANPTMAVVTTPENLSPPRDSHKCGPLVLPERCYEGIRILPSSTGLHADGWLETTSRLVIHRHGDALAKDVLEIDLYVPDTSSMHGEACLRIDIPGLLPEQRFLLQHGQNSLRIAHGAGNNRNITVKISGPVLIEPEDRRDERELLAILTAIK